MHAFIWIIDVPILVKDTIGEYVVFIDYVVKSYIPDPIKNQDLFNLVIIY